MIELRMLGRLSLTGADGREVRGLLGQPRRLALLAYLAAASPQGFHRRDTLLALFWPELDQEHARAALRQALHVVRDALGADAVASRGDEEIGLDFAQVSCDVAAFERALRIGQLEEALDLYRGALLEGFFISDAPEFEHWVETGRAGLQLAAAGAARTLAERSESVNDLTRAVRWTRRSIELAPSDEGLVRRLIALLDRQGDRAGALEAYEVFARRVAAEYDAEPAAETRALVAAVRARVRAEPAAAPAELDSRPHQGPPSKRWRGRLVMRVGLSAAAALALLVGFSVAGQRGRLHPRTPPTSNAQAYDLYLRANMLVNQRQNRENDSVAITLFERIVALDPSFAAAHAGLARAYALRVTEFAPGDTAALERARVAAEKALRLDPNLAEAHQAQARLLWGPANHFFHERAIQEDPDANPPYWHYQMALLLLHLGRRDSAFAVIRNYLRAHPDDRGGVVTSTRAVWFALGGDAHRAEQDIRTAVQKGKGYIHFHHAGFHIALAYALLQRPDSAVEWLRQVAEGGFPCYPLFEREPFLDNVRTDPGFVAFMREQKVQWEQFRGTL